MKRKTFRDEKERERESVRGTEKEEWLESYRDKWRKRRGEVEK